MPKRTSTPGCRSLPAKEVLLLGGTVEREHREHATLVRVAARVAEGAERAETGGRIFSADAGGYADAGPASDTGENRDVLFAIGRDAGAQFLKQNFETIGSRATLDLKEQLI